MCVLPSCTVGGLEHEIVVELEPFFVDLAAVRRDARLLVRQIGDERFLHPEHGVGVEIGAFGREDMGGQAFAAFLSDHEVNMRGTIGRSEEHTSELASLMSISYDVFCLKKQRASTTQQRAHS